METADIIFGIILLILLIAVFVALTVGNYRIIYLSRVKHEHTPSIAPLIGGLAGAFAVLIIFNVKYPLLIILPLIIDPGSIPLFVEFIVIFSSEMIKSKKK